MLTLRKILLFPITAIYWVVLKVRHFLFDTGFLKSISYDIPIIGVGNLALGGTGKTPLICYLTEHLRKKYSVAIVSRGYGRKTKGFYLASKTSTAKEIGDEPMIYVSKFLDVNVAVCEDRNYAVKKLLTSSNPPELILLDDCLQHRAINVSTMLLATTENAPFWEDMLLPSGNLRDIKYGAKRADAIIITKSTSEKFSNSLPAPAFKSFASYTKPQVKNGVKSQSNSYVIFSAIAHNSTFKKAVSAFGEIKKTFAYGDHHAYTNNEIEQIVAHCNAKNLSSVVTTEKDYYRLTPAQLKLFSKISLSTLEMEFEFYQKNEFLDFIENEITRNL